MGIADQSVNIVFSVFTSFIILLYTFFILLDYEAIARGWIKLIPARHREMTVHIVTDVQDGMNKYFRGQGVCRFLCRDSVQHRVSYY